MIQCDKSTFIYYANSLTTTMSSKIYYIEHFLREKHFFLLIFWHSMGKRTKLDLRLTNYFLNLQIFFCYLYIVFSYNTYFVPQSCIVNRPISSVHWDLAWGLFPGVSRRTIQPKHGKNNNMIGLLLSTAERDKEFM